MNTDLYIGKPYSQYDCWGLMQAIYRDEAGIRLDSDIYRSAGDFVEIWYDSEGEMPSPNPFDILVMRRYRPYAEHVAVAIDSDRFIHARPRTGACIEKIDKYRHKILQIVRHVKFQ